MKKLFQKQHIPNRIIGTRHGEKLYETLCTKEEMLIAEDMGDFYRIPPDHRGLNYENYYDKGRDYSSVSDYNSHNAHRLNVDETKSLLEGIEFIQNELKTRR